jgi:hypothetical protein
MLYPIELWAQICAIRNMGNGPAIVNNLIDKTCYQNSATKVLNMGYIFYDSTSIHSQNIRAAPTRDAAP